jgi:ASC-1-like (ASCH) protein
VARIVLRFRAVDKDNFEAIRDGRKRVETRAGSPRYQKIAAGDVLVFSCAGNQLEKTVREVVSVSSVDELFSKFALADVFPEAKDIEEAKATYHSYSGYREKIATYGLLAFVLE